MTKASKPPIFCLSDSQLLFWKPDNELFLKQVLSYVNAPRPKAAYIGASNDDMEEFYEIFVAAMENIGVTQCRMISSSYSNEDHEYLSQADIILLAGGDVMKGWQVFEETGMKITLQERRDSGAVLIGVSAGAIQMGLHWRVTHVSGAVALLPMLNFMPIVIEAHDEKNRWRSLKETVRLSGKAKLPEFSGIGIPSGGGMLYFENGDIEAVRYDLVEFSMEDGELGFSYIASPEDYSNLLLH